MASTTRGGAPQYAARRLHPAQLDVAVEGLAAETDREHRDAGGLNRQERLAETAVGVVGAVRHHDQPGQRHARQLLVRPNERLAETGARAAVRQLVDVAEPIRLRREPEEAKREALLERGAQIAARPEPILDEAQPLRFVAVRDLHAARVVEQHAQEVLLRHDRREHHDRLQEAEGDHRQCAEPDRRQHTAIERLAVAPDLRVCPQREGSGCDCRAERDRPGRPDGEVTLLEHERPVLEQELEDRFEHRSRASVSLRRYASQLSLRPGADRSGSAGPERRELLHHRTCETRH